MADRPIFQQRPPGQIPSGRFIQSQSAPSQRPSLAQQPAYERPITSRETIEARAASTYAQQTTAAQAQAEAEITAEIESNESAGRFYYEGEWLTTPKINPHSDRQWRGSFLGGLYSQFKDKFGRDPSNAEKEQLKDAGISSWDRVYGGQHERAAAGQREAVRDYSEQQLQQTSAESPTQALTGKLTSALTSAFRALPDEYLYGVETQKALPQEYMPEVEYAPDRSGLGNVVSGTAANFQELASDFFGFTKPEVHTSVDADRETFDLPEGSPITSAPVDDLNSQLPPVVQQYKAHIDSGTFTSPVTQQAGVGPGILDIKPTMKQKATLDNRVFTQEKLHEQYTELGRVAQEKIDVDAFIPTIIPFRKYEYTAGPMKGQSIVGRDLVVKMEQYRASLDPYETSVKEARAWYSATPPEWVAFYEKPLKSEGGLTASQVRENILGTKATSMATIWSPYDFFGYKHFRYAAAKQSGFGIPSEGVGVDATKYSPYLSEINKSFGFDDTSGKNVYYAGRGKGYKKRDTVESMGKDVLEAQRQFATNYAMRKVTGGSDAWGMGEFIAKSPPVQVAAIYGASYLGASYLSSWGSEVSRLKAATVRTSIPGQVSTYAVPLYNIAPKYQTLAKGLMWLDKNYIMASRLGAVGSGAMKAGIPLSIAGGEYAKYTKLRDSGASQLKAQSAVFGDIGYMAAFGGGMQHGFKRPAPFIKQWVQKHPPQLLAYKATIPRLYKSLETSSLTKVRGLEQRKPHYGKAVTAKEYYTMQNPKYSAGQRFSYYTLDVEPDLRSMGKPRDLRAGYRLTISAHAPQGPTGTIGQTGKLGTTGTVKLGTTGKTFSIKELQTFIKQGYIPETVIKDIKFVTEYGKQFARGGVKVLPIDIVSKGGTGAVKFGGSSKAALQQLSTGQIDKMTLRFDAGKNFQYKFALNPLQGPPPQGVQRVQPWIEVKIPAESFKRVYHNGKFFGYEKAIPVDPSVKWYASKFIDPTTQWDIIKYKGGVPLKGQTGSGISLQDSFSKLRSDITKPTLFKQVKVTPTIDTTTSLLGDIDDMSKILTDIKATTGDLKFSTPLPDISKGMDTDFLIPLSFTDYEQKQFTAPAAIQTPKLGFLPVLAYDQEVDQKQQQDSMQGQAQQTKLKYDQELIQIVGPQQMYVEKPVIDEPLIELLPPVPSSSMFKIPIPKRRKADAKKRKRFGSFDVQVKQKKKWKTLKRSMYHNDALDFGAKHVDTTPTVRFRLKKSRKRPIDVPNTNYFKLNKQKFRPYIVKKGKAKQLRPSEFIERRRFRIDSPGELGGITKKGWKTRGINIFKTPKFRSSKLPKVRIPSIL